MVTVAIWLPARARRARRGLAKIISLFTVVLALGFEFVSNRCRTRRPTPRPRC